MNQRINRLLSLLPSVALPFVAWWSVACGGEEEEVGITLVIDSTEIVRFRADASLQQIRDVATAPSGDIWVLQGSNAPHVFKFSEDGKLLDSFGMSGGGRGMLSNPLWLLPTDDAGTPMGVWDTGNRRVINYRNDGRVRETQAVERSRGMVLRDIEDHSYGRPLSMERFGGGYLLMDHPTGLATTGGYLRSQLLRLDGAGAVVDTFIDFDREWTEAAAAVGRADLFVPIPLWATCPGGELVLFDPFNGTLEWFGPDGSVLGSDSVSLPSREVTEEDQRTYLWREFELRAREQLAGDDPDSALIERSIERFLIYSRTRFHATTPPAVDLLCGPKRQVWFETFSTEDHPLGYGRTWIVHGLQQAEDVRVQFPVGFRPMEISGDRALGVFTGDPHPGMPTVASVPLPPGVAVTR